MGARSRAWSSLAPSKSNTPSTVTTRTQLFEHSGAYVRPHANRSHPAHHPCQPTHPIPPATLRRPQTQAHLCTNTGVYTPAEHIPSSHSLTTCLPHLGIPFVAPSVLHLSTRRFRRTHLTTHQPFPPTCVPSQPASPPPSRCRSQTHGYAGVQIYREGCSGLLCERL